MGTVPAITLPQLAAMNPAIRAILESGLPHFEARDEICRLGVTTSEASVRRYRERLTETPWKKLTLAEKAESDPRVREVITSGVSSAEAAAMLKAEGRHASPERIRHVRHIGDYTAAPATTEEPVQSEIEVLRHQLGESKKRERTLARQLHEVKHKHQDYLDTLWEAVETTVQAQVIPPVTVPQVKATSGKSEVAVALLSDMQTGKITPTYNSEICAERVARYADKVIKLTQIQEKNHPVRECVVHCLGDMLEGVDIFPGQQWLIDSTLYTQLLDTTPVIIADFARRLLTYFDKVTLRCVDGNHGRIGRKGQFGPMDNADRMVYRIVKLMLRDEPRVTVEMTDPEGERNWFLISEIGNYRCLLIHGDQIRGHSGLPWYGFQKKVNSWAAGGLGVDEGLFSDVHMGHWHQLAMIPLNKKRVYVNGSTESYNTFAQEQLAAQSDPSQWLLFVEPEDGRVTASYAVDLT